jgi:protein-tyrosine kinase
MASRTLDILLQDIKRTFRSHTVIFDMPPLLQGGEVLAMLPRVDVVLLVTAVGVSTVHEVKECNKHLQASEFSISQTKRSADILLVRASEPLVSRACP